MVEIAHIEEKLEYEIRAGLLSCLDSEPKSKDDIRNILANRRRERLVERYSRLSVAERFFINAVDVPIDWYNIKPALKWVENDQEEAIWKYTRNIVSSMPEDSYVGRRTKSYFVDENSGRWLGIVMLSSSLGVNKVRDERVGWNQERRYKNLVHVANIAVCVPIQPFGTLCGGKLLFVSALSNEVRAEYYNLYGDELLAVETTSLYGKSSQYNRVKEFKFLGYTGGFGTAHIPDELWQKIHQYYTLRFGSSKPKKKAQARFKHRELAQVAKAVGVDTKAAKHGQRRGYYWGITAENSEAVLRGEDGNSPTYYNRPLQELTDFWHKRWYEMRLPKKWDEVQSFDPSIYLLDNNVPEEYQKSREQWLF